MADPRDRRGVRHDLPTILCLAVTGILAGCGSLMAIWEHATDLEADDLRSSGLEAGRALPSESTIRRVLQDLDPVDLDARLTSWLYTRTGAIAGRRVIAVDGKTMRGARTGDNPAPHLLAALDRASGVVVGQRRVSDKSNEIPALPELLAPPGPGRGPDHRRRHAHPGEYGRVDHLPGRPLPVDGQGQPARSAPDAQGPALEGRPGPVHPRRLPRAAGAAHRPGRRGPRPGRLPRRRPGDPDPPHHHSLRALPSRGANPRP